MSRFTNSEAKACPDLVERFGALRPDERWMTAPRGEVAERADASIRQDSVTQAAWRRFQPLPAFPERRETVVGEDLGCMRRSSL